MSLRLYPISAHASPLSNQTDLLNELFPEGGSEGDNGRGAAALTRQVSGSVFDRWSMAKKGDEVKTETTTARNAFDPLSACLPSLICLKLNISTQINFHLTGFMELTLNRKIVRPGSFTLAAERYQFISD